MVIYAEYLFLENALTGGLIIFLTGKIAGITCGKPLLIIGSIVCGLYSFILFCDSLHPLVAFISKLCFSVILILVVFRPAKLRKLARITMIFYLISFALGGITIGTMYFLGIEGLTHNSSLYLGIFGYLYILFGCILTYIFFSLLSDFIKGRLIKERTFADVEVFIGDKAAIMKGMVDTGNFLNDPLTGNPVMIISAIAAKKILPSEVVDEIMKATDMRIITKNLTSSVYAARISLIPFHSIGKERGCLIGIRSDKIHIKLHNEKNEDFIVASKGTILAIYKGRFSGGQSDDDCSILLHPGLLEGGIANV